MSDTQPEIKVGQHVRVMNTDDVAHWIAKVYGSGRRAEGVVKSIEGKEVFVLFPWGSQLSFRESQLSTLAPEACENCGQDPGADCIHEMSNDTHQLEKLLCGVCRKNMGYELA